MTEYEKWVRAINRIHVTDRGEQLLHRMTLPATEDRPGGVDAFFRADRRNRIELALMLREARRRR